MKKLCLLFSLILTGCGTVTPVPTPQSPVLEFQSPTIVKKDVAEKEGLDLTVGIFALNKNVVFLFGGMMAYDGEYKSLQSTLLRSEDNGMHWKEVMTPISDSSICEFTLLESGIGWALIYTPLMNYEPEKYRLYQTVDYGMSWKEISTIPLSEDFPSPLQMIFVDELHGHIDMLYEFSYLEFLTTNDGGVHWTQSGKFEPEFEGNVSGLKILDSYRALNTDISESFSLDHSGFWKLDGRYGDPNTHIITIQHQIFTDDGSLNVEKMILPRHFDFVDGQIIASRTK
ncbi:MAG: WD40/YVTN/BNR-like repeat-containing protein [Chloroflexota bacterium]